MVGMASFLATFKGSSHRLWRDHSSPIVNRQAEDGGAVDAPGVRRLSGPFFRVGVAIPGITTEWFH